MESLNELTSDVRETVKDILIVIKKELFYINMYHTAKMGGSADAMATECQAYVNKLINILKLTEPVVEYKQSGVYMPKSFINLIHETNIDTD